MQNSLIVIVGPTAVGKTDLSIDIAKQFSTEIFSADSRQFYKELSIGTAIPTEEQLNIVKHHFIHHKSVTEYYNAYIFESDVIKKLSNYFKKNRIAVLVGGSGMYIDAVCHGIDLIPDVDIEIRESLIERLNNEGIESLRFELKKLDLKYYNQVDLKNSQRILRALEVCIQTGKPFSSFRTNKIKNRNFNIIKIGLNYNREILYERINDRVDLMIQKGLINEAKNSVRYKNHYALKTVGYRELFDYFDKKHNLEKAIELIKRNTRRYAKRQITWFNKDNNINWFRPNQTTEIKQYIYSRI